MLKKSIVLTNIFHSEQLIKELKIELEYLNVALEIYLDIQLAVTEAINNAFLHGCKNIPKPQVVVEWDIRKNSFEFKVKDNGPGFNLAAVSRNCGEKLLEEKGRGIFLIEQVVDKVWFNKKGNEIYGFKSW